MPLLSEANVDCVLTMHDAVNYEYFKMPRRCRA